MARLILVYNPNSSNFRRVKKEILEKKSTIFANYELSEYTIKKIGFANNVQNFVKELKNGDLVLALGGDATAAIAVNAILESKKDATLSVLPYGNFNDLARTLGTMKLDDLGVGAVRCFEESVGGHDRDRRSAPPVTTGRRDSVSERHLTAPTYLYPLEIYVDDKFWRYATCYVTIGMTAEAVELFDDPKFRKYMKKGHKSSWRSYLELAKWYFKNRHSKIFLPEFTVNGNPTKKNASDYAAVNGKSMCRVMRGGQDFKNPQVFRSKNLKTTSFPQLFCLMASSILFRVPGEETKSDTLEFKNPATVELQAEGEYQIFKNIKKIEIKKGNQCLKVIQKN